jgi:septum site-determining protein MinC
LSKLSALRWKNEDFFASFFLFRCRNKNARSRMIFLKTATEGHDRSMTDLVTFKGNREGLIAVLDLDADFYTVLDRFAAKLTSARDFLSGSAVSVDVGPRDLQAEQIEALRLVLEHNNLRLRRILAGPSFSEEQPQGVQEVKQVEQEAVREQTTGHSRKRKSRRTAAAAEQADSVSAADGATDSVGEQQTGETREEIPVISMKTPVAPRADIISQEQTILIQRTVRSGQRVFYGGNVVVLGDVNPGAEIVAGGNIICKGTFRGIAHAGAMGEYNSVVAALRLEPSQLRIAEFITRAPDGDFSQSSQPEIARVQDGVVIIEHYQPGSERYSRRHVKGGA